MNLSLNTLYLSGKFIIIHVLCVVITSQLNNEGTNNHQKPSNVIIITKCNPQMVISQQATA